MCKLSNYLILGWIASVSQHRLTPTRFGVRQVLVGGGGGIYIMHSAKLAISEP